MTGLQELEIDPLDLDTNSDEILGNWLTSSNIKLLIPVGNFNLEFYRLLKL